MIAGDECDLNFLTFVLHSGKTLNQEIDPVGDRTRARCVRSTNDFRGNEIVGADRSCPYTIFLEVLWFGQVFSGVFWFFFGTNFIPPFLPTHLIHFASFNLIRLYESASGMVSRHPCNLKTFNKGASSHLIPRPDPVSYMS